MFNYYLPGLAKEKVAPGDKIDHRALPGGLGDVLADIRSVPADAAVLDARNGPDGKSGCVIVPTRKYHGVPDVHYDPTYQDCIDGGTGYWLLVRKGEAISPQLLERKDVVRGADVGDQSGHQWQAPIARTPHAAHAFGFLPQAFAFDAAGEPVAKLLKSHEWLWDLAGEIRDWYLPAADEAAQAAKPPFGWLVKQAARLLAVNYRVGPVELNYLSNAGSPVLTSETVHVICQAAYGFEVLEETKKN